MDSFCGFSALLKLLKYIEQSTFKGYKKVWVDWCKVGWNVLWRRLLRSAAAPPTNPALGFAICFCLPRLVFTIISCPDAIQDVLHRMLQNHNHECITLQTLYRYHGVFKAKMVSQTTHFKVLKKNLHLYFYILCLFVFFIFSAAKATGGPRRADKPVAISWAGR